MAKNILSLEIPDVMNTCDLCNKPFNKKASNQRYCSYKCNRKVLRVKRGCKSPELGTKLKCKGCSKEFVKEESRQIYCTVQCSITYLGKLYYQSHKENFRINSEKRRMLIHPYKKYKKKACELCGFTALHTCQLDVDHLDGNHHNNEPNNLQTLCANCHRLKTFLNKDGVYSRNKYLKAV